MQPVQLCLHYFQYFAGAHGETFWGATIQVQPLRENFQMETGPFKTFQDPLNEGRISKKNILGLTKFLMSWVFCLVLKYMTVKLQDHKCCIRAPFLLLDTIPQTHKEKADLRFVKKFTQPDFRTKNCTHNLRRFFSKRNSINALIQQLFVRVELSV